MIRPVEKNDLPALKAVIDATGLFPGEMLDDMTSGYFHDQMSGDLWYTHDEDGPRAVAYVAPERMTAGTWNLYLIAVHPDQQRQGVGAAMIHYIERHLAEKGHRVLLVETSGLPEFEKTRAFYLKCHYDQEARIRDFYDAGEDKVVFRKSLV